MFCIQSGTELPFLQLGRVFVGIARCLEVSDVLAPGEN